MPRRDPRDPLDVTGGPSRGSICPGCGFEWAVVTTGDGARLDKGKHLVCHARWEIAHNGRVTPWLIPAIISILDLIDHYRTRLSEVEADRDDALDLADTLASELTALQEEHDA